jgi:hypothetical protein
MFGAVFAIELQQRGLNERPYSSATRFTVVSEKLLPQHGVPVVYDCEILCRCKSPI